MLIKLFVFAILVVSISGLYTGTKNYSEQARYSDFRVEMEEVEK